VVARIARPNRWGMPAYPTSPSRSPRSCMSRTSRPRCASSPRRSASLRGITTRTMPTSSARARRSACSSTTIRMRSACLTAASRITSTCATLGQVLAELGSKLAELPQGDVYGPVDQPYNQRELMVRAPDGNLMVFGQAIGQKLTLSGDGRCRAPRARPPAAPGRRSPAHARRNPRAAARRSSRTSSRRRPRPQAPARQSRAA